MAYTNQNNDAVGIGTTSVAATATYSAITQGDLLIATVCNNTNTTIPVVYDSNATWTILGSYNGGTTGQAVAIYAKIAVPSQPTVVTAGTTTTTNTTKQYLAIHEFRGGPAAITGSGSSASIVDNAQSVGSGNSATVTSSSGAQPSVTTTNAADLIITVAFLSGSAGGNPVWSGATALSHNPNNTVWLQADAFQIETSTGTYNPFVTWSTARAVQQLTVALLPGSTQPASPGDNFLSLGVG